MLAFPFRLQVCLHVAQTATVRLTTKERTNTELLNGKQNTAVNKTFHMQGLNL